jgi:predicted transcriptional regulator
MKTTLTLWLDDEIKRKAKALAQRRKISVSQLFAEMIEAAYRADREVKQGGILRRSSL